MDDARPISRPRSTSTKRFDTADLRLLASGIELCRRRAGHPDQASQRRRPPRGCCACRRRPGEGDPRCRCRARTSRVSTRTPLDQIDALVRRVRGDAELHPVGRVHVIRSVTGLTATPARDATARPGAAVPSATRPRWRAGARPWCGPAPSAPTCSSGSTRRCAAPASPTAQAGRGRLAELRGNGPAEPPRPGAKGQRRTARARLPRPAGRHPLTERERPARQPARRRCTRCGSRPAGPLPRCARSARCSRPRGPRLVAEAALALGRALAGEAGCRGAERLTTRLRALEPGWCSGRCSRRHPALHTYGPRPAPAPWCWRSSTAGATPRWGRLRRLLADPAARRPGPGKPATRCCRMRRAHRP
ncbi:hypothetical protein HBB16_16855 [Pseudonocardia sp. MCCB 268]|nr:hypothetical protein [Pseudonocardia cytotoxica]